MYRYQTLDTTDEVCFLPDVFFARSPTEERPPHKFPPPPTRVPLGKDAYTFLVLPPASPRIGMLHFVPTRTGYAPTIGVSGGAYSPAACVGRIGGAPEGRPAITV